MNGHDEDKNPDKTSTPSKQGIFSTPELTVDTEKIAKNAEDMNTANRARINSFFADTDATQRSQELNNSLVTTNTTSTQTTEDIVIDNGERKTRKRLIIIIATLIIVIGICLTILVVTGNSNKKLILTTFEDYFSYLKNGPQDFGEEFVPSDDIYFLFALDDIETTNANKLEYAKNLIIKHELFLDAIIKTNPDIPNVSHENVLSIAQIDQDLLKLILHTILLKQTQNQLLEKYTQSGQAQAYNFIEEITSMKSNSSTTSNLATNLSEYLKQELSLLQIYEAQNCITGITINAYCKSTLSESNTTYNNILEQQLVTKNNLRYSLSSAERLLVYNTKSFISVLGVNNE